MARLRSSRQAVRVVASLVPAQARHVIRRQGPACRCSFRHSSALHRHVRSTSRQAGPGTACSVTAVPVTSRPRQARRSGAWPGLSRLGAACRCAAGEDWYCSSVRRQAWQGEIGRLGSDRPLLARRGLARRGRLGKAVRVTASLGSGRQGQSRCVIARLCCVGLGVGRRGYAVPVDPCPGNAAQAEPGFSMHGFAQHVRSMQAWFVVALRG